MIISFWSRNNFTLFPQWGESDSSADEVMRVTYVRWLGRTWCKVTNQFAASMLELIKLSPDEVATVAGAYAKIRTMVSKETQWLRDSQSEQIARRLDAENRCREAEKKYNELVKSMQIVRQAGLAGILVERQQERWRELHLDDGK